jgi:hypothetical protein
MTLTKSTLAGNGNNRKTPKEQKGYISDYYLNKNTNNNDSESGTKRMILNEGNLLSKDHSKKEIINSGAYQLK